MALKPAFIMPRTAVRTRGRTRSVGARKPPRSAVRVAICVTVGYTLGAITAFAVPRMAAADPARRNQDGAWGHIAPGSAAAAPSTTACTAA